jgi:hypothetical protein
MTEGVMEGVLLGRGVSVTVGARLSVGLKALMVRVASRVGKVGETSRICTVVVCISTALPGYLLHRGLPWPWALALLSGFAEVSVLSFILGRALR